MSELRERLAAELTQHQTDIGMTRVLRSEPGPGNYVLACTCGAEYSPSPERSDELAHLADALMPIVAQEIAAARAEALRRAADDWAADPDAVGDSDKDARNWLRDRAALARARIRGAPVTTWRVVYGRPFPGWRDFPTHEQAQWFADNAVAHETPTIHELDSTEGEA